MTTTCDISLVRSPFCSLGLSPPSLVSSDLYHRPLSSLALYGLISLSNTTESPAPPAFDPYLLLSLLEAMGELSVRLRGQHLLLCRDHPVKEFTPKPPSALLLNHELSPFPWLISLGTQHMLQFPLPLNKIKHCPPPQGPGLVRDSGGFLCK